jgi:hypothetical protein
MSNKNIVFNIITVHLHVAKANLGSVTDRLLR